MQHTKPLVTVKELRQIVGSDRLGRPTAYAIARLYGIRLGRRLLVPARVVEALLEGRLQGFEAGEKEG